MTARFLSTALAVTVAATMVLSASAVTGAAPAHATVECDAYVPENGNPANPADLTIYVDEVAVDEVAYFQIWEMCMPSSMTMNITGSNSPGGTLNVTADGTSASGFYFTPAAAFSGLAQFDVTLTSGAQTWDFRLYAYVGVPGAQFAPQNYPNPLGNPVTATVGVPVEFDLTGQTFPSGTSGTMSVLNPSAAFSASYDDSGPTLTVTPLQNIGGPMQVKVLVGNGIQARAYWLYLWVGVPVPTVPVWGPQPAPVQIDPLGTGYFFIKPYAPRGWECEIKVTVDPDIAIAAEPPSMSGTGSNIAISVMEPYVGLLVVNYWLGCRPPDTTGPATSSQNYAMKLYVGIPIPALADTGSETAPPLLLGGLLLLFVGGGVIIARRVVRRRMTSAR